MKTNIIVASIFIIAIVIAGVVIFLNGRDAGNPDIKNNVSMAGDTQIIAITAKGGYFPNITTAKANTPTVIKMSTSGTFDCSSALMIPALGYRENLAPSGVTDIQVPPQKPGTTLQGVCSMGMYNFAIRFE